MPELRYTFRKKEHLCLTKQIDSLFENGRWLRSSSIRLVYRETEDKLAAPVQVMFSVPKKIHRKAVARNLIKRRMRESYRLNKTILTDIPVMQERNILVGFVYSSAEIGTYRQIEAEMKQLLAQLASRISKFP